MLNTFTWVNVFFFTFSLEGGNPILFYAVYDSVNFNEKMMLIGASIQRLNEKKI